VDPLGHGLLVGVAVEGVEQPLERGGEERRRNRRHQEAQQLQVRCRVDVFIYIYREREIDK